MNNSMSIHVMKEKSSFTRETALKRGNGKGRTAGMFSVYLRTKCHWAHLAG